MSKFLQLFAFLIFSSSAAWSAQIFRTGNSQDLLTATNQSVCLAGGGSDDAWAGGWSYLLRQSGGGDIVIIRADDRQGGYESWIYNDDDHHQFPKVNSVTTLLIEKASDANRPDVVNAILKAEMIFFAGGNQSIYIDWFNGSKLAAAVNYVMQTKKIPIAGTSAGMALLAGIDYSARYFSPADQESNVTAEDVMKNPTAKFVDLDRRVITAPYLSNVITESHFSQRDRQGRIMGFMARAVYNDYQNINYKNIKAIAADEGTAVCYNDKGIGKVFGDGSVFFLKGNKQIERIEKNKSLNWYDQGDAISTYIISGKDSSAVFDFKSWTGYGGVQESWAVDGRNENDPVVTRH